MLDLRVLVVQPHRLGNRRASAHPMADVARDIRNESIDRDRQEHVDPANEDPLARNV
jgi:hypothetical protein